MREAEQKYWNDQVVLGNKIRSDNFWKRQAILKRLCALDIISKNVIEIGCGNATAFGALSHVLLGNFGYLGTELASLWAESAHKVFGFQTVETDIVNIPVEDSQFDYCVALDSLEHVRPEDREKGYSEVSRVLKPAAAVVLNIPLDVSGHNDEFDHGFKDKDLFELLSSCRMRLHTYETYSVLCGKKKVKRSYAWAIGKR